MFSMSTTPFAWVSSAPGASTRLSHARTETHRVPSVNVPNLLLEKPVDLEGLRALVERRLSPPSETTALG